MPDLLPTTKVQDIAHSRIGASSAHRWLKCPGSVRLCKDIPNKSSPYAREGTAAHEVASRCQIEGVEAWELAGECIEVEGEKFHVGNEMIDSVQLYLDTIANDARGAEKYVEVRVALPDVHEALFGTSDCLVYDPVRNGGHLFVYDFKYGVGVPVDPEQNEQMMIYAAGAISTLLADKPELCINVVELVIVQPRADHQDGPVRRWCTTLDSLGEWVNAVLEPGAKATDAEDASLALGDWCQFCDAKLVCPLMRGNADTAQKETEAADPLGQFEDWELSERMSRKASVLSYYRALEDEVFNRLMKGTPMPGFKLVQKKSNRVWKDGAEKIIAEALGDAAYERKLKGPAQVEKIKGGRELTQEHAYKPDTGLTLAEEKDNRSAVPMRSASDAFAGV